MHYWNNGNAIFILLFILIGCENEEVVDSYYTKEMGLEWAEKYNQKLTELENEEIEWHYNIKVDIASLQIAVSYAQNRERTIEEIKERAYTYALLENYARNKGLYPPTISHLIKKLTTL